MNRAAVLAAHVFPGDITVALTEAWIDCPCGERIVLPVEMLTVAQADVVQAWAEHLDAALTAQEGDQGEAEEMKLCSYGPSPHHPHGTCPGAPVCPCSTPGHSHAPSIHTEAMSDG